MQLIYITASGRKKMNDTVSAPENNSGQPARVLLVDDNSTNLQLLLETLEGLGYKLLIAKNGKTALAIAQKAADARAHFIGASGGSAADRGIFKQV